MNSVTGGTYFSGGDLVAEGMLAAGTTPIFGVEIDDAIAEVARSNGHHVRTADVCATDPATLPRVDVFHASPSCKNASTAKTDAKESPEDIASAHAVCRYLEYHRPRVFTLENVYGYRKFDAFAAILKTLSRCGYKWDYWHLNSADYGVPQTRKRLILIASLSFQPTKPPETHSEYVLPMFETLEKWVGWYEALTHPRYGQDLIPTLPESKFADWQLERLPKELFDSTIFGNDASDDHNGGTYGVIARPSDKPTIVVKASPSYMQKAFIVSATEARIVTARSQDKPTRTLKGAGERLPRAFIVNTREGHHGEGITVADSDEPIYTLPASSTGNRHKAFIMPNENSGSAVIRTDTEPSPTIGATQRVGNVSRAFIVGDQYDQPQGTIGRKPQIAYADEPTMVVRANSNGGTQPRAWLACGKVVKMTPRALARFQSIRDGYLLPAKVSLACEIIGNAVPSLLAEKIYRHVLSQLA